MEVGTTLNDAATLASLDPRDVRFGHPPLPSWVTGFRDHQVPAIEEVMGHLDRGVRVVLINAPVGSGKTLIGEAVRRLHPSDHALYVATTKSLQDQFATDFPYAKLLKGRRNYPTLDNPELFDDPFKPLTAGDCTKERTMVPACGGCELNLMPLTAVMHCDNCHPWYKCPYEVAKQEAMQAQIAVTNTAFFVGEANGPGRFSEQDLVIVDECDTLESLLMGQVEVVISERMRKKLHLPFPSRKTVESAWVEWVQNDALPTAKTALAQQHAAVMKKRTVEGVKELQRLERLLGRLLRMSEEITAEGGIGWVYDSSQEKQGQIVFRPIKVDGIAEEMFWKHSKQWVLMSGTIIDPVEFTESLGLHGGWEMVTVPNTFPKENRPIHVVNGAVSMAHKAVEASGGENIKKLAELIAKVLRKHPDERILVHTVSYKLTQDLFDLLRREFGDRLIVYGGGGERDKAMAAYREKANAVALAPSWDRGVDLPGDLCTVMVVAKVPFPNLGDKQVSARLYSRGGDLWYRVNTVRTFVQMLGRGVRSESDRCVTYVLDRQFLDNVWNKSKSLIPGYVKEAVDFSGGGL